jgi:hypothetical protein
MYRELAEPLLVELRKYSIELEEVVVREGFQSLSRIPRGREPRRQGDREAGGRGRRRRNLSSN